jgi:ribose 5-phosphate isomerase B
VNVALGCDHVALDLKRYLAAKIVGAGHEVIDVGTYTTERVDYPTYGEAAARQVVDGNADRAIVMCGSGVGISIAASKVRGIRCVLCSEPYSALMSREHNDANVLALGARVVGPELAWMIVRTWLDGQFRSGRHASRVAQLEALDAARGL